MKHLVLTVSLALAALPAAAQEPQGKSLMEQGAELFFEGLRQELEPALEDLRDLADQFGPAMQSFLQEMGPALAELAAQVQDWSAYEAPEMLPNGDIIIRKKPQPSVPDSPAPKAEEDRPEGEDVTDI
ncbi:hypothetical protein SAMN05444279_103122 [Ruegeria intermedia]|uniref:AAA+ family ATPase n=1 Tax=Ruegeria intermedia TaxID=996115 RepID=A0A1M4U1H3_9RHOB|nr:hypothetical protein [Ruegeria intermedia]SHE50523.1 hypothetical protein SAMN05444279_103122 [Ruegeria intermedia]